MMKKNLKENKTNTNCHSSLDGESHQIPACAGMTLKEKVAGMTHCGESGRSMVEMLGVLAIVGVLSIAGIAGYSMAMRNHRTNEVLNAASMLYVMAMAKNQGTGADTNYAELGTPPSGITLAYTASNKKITITFANEDDCKQAKNKLGDKAPEDCTVAEAPTTGYNLTINFGEVVSEPTVVVERPAFDEAAYYGNNQPGCPDGWFMVTSTPSSELFCVTGLQDASEECVKRFSSDGVTGAGEYPGTPKTYYCS